MANTKTAREVERSQYISDPKKFDETVEKLKTDLVDYCEEQGYTLPARVKFATFRSQGGDDEKGKPRIFVKVSTEVKLTAAQLETYESNKEQP